MIATSLSPAKVMENLPIAVEKALRSAPVMIVDTGAIKRNFSRLAAMTRGRCAAIVKGDAYGHGMLPSARALREAGASLYFTARFEDAVNLRMGLGSGPQIAVLDGVPANLLEEAVQQDITPVVNSLGQLQALTTWTAQAARPVQAFVHIDSAMNRLGLALDEIATAAPLLGGVDVLAYMTHFASADDIDIDLCRLQVTRLRTAVAGLPPAPLSIANSAGVFLGDEFHGDLIRPGKSTFGINPLATGPNPLEEPATVLAPVVQIRDIRRGEAVGYSETWRAPSARRIAVLGIGYSNGYLRSNSNRGHVAFGSLLAPVVGRVSMDLVAVDVTHLPEGLAIEGRAAEILGPNICYRDLAGWSGTNEHEALIDLGRGCLRVHI